MFPFEAHHFVYLSTITFLAIVFFLAKDSILGLLDGKREEIKNLISETRRKHDDVTKLYQEFDAKMQKISQERDVILADASKKADIMLANAEQEIATMKQQQIQDLERRIADYETQVQNQMIAGATDKIIALLQQKLAGNQNAPLDFSGLKKTVS